MKIMKDSNIILIDNYYDNLITNSASDIKCISFKKQLEYFWNNAKSHRPQVA